MSAPKILVIPGSARTGSVNKKLAAFAAEKARSLGADVTLLDLNDYPAPVYHGDEEAESGLPGTMRALKAEIRAHDAMIVVTPEYNGHIPPLLINAFDWVSRAEGEDKANPFDGKLAAIMAASPGGLGGARVIGRLRAFLSDLGAMPIPGFASVPGAFQAFNADGALTNERSAAQVDSLVSKLVGWLTRD